MTETSGDLTEIPEVALELARAASSEDSSPIWNVEIRAPSWPKAVVLASETKEEDGYAQLERWAKLLECDAVDRTGTEVVRTAPGAWNAPLARRAAPEATAGGFAVRVSAHPPRGSRIVVTSERGRRRVVIPPTGYSVGTAIFVAFGAVFGGFGGLAAMVGAGVITGGRVNGEMPDGPVWFLAALGSLFFLIGILLALAALVGGRTREWIEDAPDRLVVGSSGIGLTWGRKTLLKRAVEGVDLSVSPNATWSKVAARRDGRTGPPAGVDRDVRIRTDTRVLRIGRYLPEADQT